MDRSKLSKLLALTQSSNDHEALLALRKANALVLAHGATWEAVMRDAPAPQKRFDDPFSVAVDEMLNYCEEHLASAWHRQQVSVWREAASLNMDNFFELVKLYRKLKKMVAGE